MGVWATVVDPHHHRLACALVRDPDLGAERQGLVGRGQVVGVQALAVGGLLAVKAGAVPRGRAGPDWLALLSRSRSCRKGAAKEKGGDGQGIASFGRGLRSPPLLRCTMQYVVPQ